MSARTGWSLISLLVLLGGPASAQTATDAATANPPPASAASPAPVASPTPSDSASAPAPPATQPPTVPSAVPPTESAPSTPAETAALGVVPPPEGKGQVVFFRPSSLRGAVIWFMVKENGAPLGKLTNGAYFVQVADPGPHTYTGATENKNVLRMEVDAGETYYVRGSIQMGLLIGEADMTPSDQTAFEKAFKKMHLAKPVGPETAPPTGDAASK